uniref:DNA_MISMATCH_REPAIR_2 domain-containing protein n=1 Tax=Haemonchus contortus TaxID=6289 RepID=A0A7I4Y7V4_HAECO|nr:DNA mismatch repair protein MutS domain containing protein [Haemonchus contortus]
MDEEQEIVPSSQLDDSAIILAISYSAGYLGAAVYDQGRTTIKLLRDVAEDHEFRLLTALIQQEEPTTILSNKAQDVRMVSFICVLCGEDPPPDDVYVEHSSDLGTTGVTHSAGSLAASGEISSHSDDLTAQSVTGESKDKEEEQPVEDGDEEDIEDDDFDPEPKPPTLIFLPNNAYNYESGFKRISELFAGECFSESENQLVTRFRIDISSRNMVRAMGALLRYLDSARIGVEFEPLNVRTPVTAIKSIVVAEMVEIDEATYRALDIFAENKKAERNYRHGVARHRCAVSLFSLCNRCKSGIGRNTLRKWFERPTTNQDILVSRQQAISYFLQDCNLDTTGKIYGLLGSMRSMRYILDRLRSGTAKVRHWESLYKMLSNAVSIGRYMETFSTKLSLVDDDRECFGDTLTETAAVLGAMIDFHESRLENRIVVNSGVDPELDRAKDLYRRLPAILTQVAQDESKRLQADTCSVAYVPMIGYLLAIPYDFDVKQFDDLQVIYSTDKTLNVKSERMRELDEELGDVKMKIIDKETTITIRMSSLLLSRSSLLLGVERVACLLDAAISLALTARQLGWNRPKFVEEPIIDATRVVHPLSKLITEHFVANPISSGGEYTRIKIFTGPNACGKSMYLKQVGLLVFLAHIGSFVPAEVAHIGIVNRIFSRLYTVDSVLDGMSTFANDLNQVSVALRRGNERSLVIIDEFGKGTMTEVGLPLLSSTLSYWAAKGKDSCPHVFVSSHFHALPNFITDEHEIVSYHTMEVRCRGAELDFQYRLVDGVVDLSYAAYTASKMGIPQDVGDRANQVYEHILKGHGIGDMVIDSEEERKNRWLAKQMLEIWPQVEEWDIDSDLHCLLDHLQGALFEADEMIESDSADHTENEHPDGATSEETSNLPASEQESEKLESENEDSDQEVRHTFEESTPTLPSALRSREKKSDRSNLSVSFAVDIIRNEHTVEAKGLNATTDSDLEQPESFQRLVIADTDSEVTVDRDRDHSQAVTCSTEIMKQKDVESGSLSQNDFLPSKRSLSDDFSKEVIVRKRSRSF